ncbi:UDP-3-O-[3-hydroxymyristoyl] N-acetylglucosamine deacetylase [Moraxella caviae]|uniref:UDP-3-O-acyl-N-acetylglucosamine deacetylase n=1 Tax=Moraxella caviae TaxID=34060 RepID=A0A1T0A2I1_9GAMM|nr:UDP-3-O-acyl-N-acetylglucosamine deacetylase [Moraxella caviae]OOR89481.1 UDP-3-O-[3-hydroxymyristoyl] N-acetylglucosamine deacetylase [Moraxella caviae]STZ09833.1 UDP-3-O-[3-hydroxymyristoyl] N-acetylglucosamine deacetylase [Moraxella caviae]VEW13113.1 UDP-3-O-[3-hydroxymyristoyl] N-acetylglucosamine deacetylase [Moraxella caviae]
MTKQRTIAQAITATGIGLHSGKKVTLTLLPAECDTGIVFERVDLDGASVAVHPEQIHDTMMSSNLVQGEARIGTIEHLMSAIAAFGIDNLRVQVDAAEIPIMDGSAAPFLFLLSEVGVVEQSAAKKFIKILKPVRVEDGDKWAQLMPYDGGFLMDFEIDFSHAAIAATDQKTTLDFNTANFAREVGQARTFGFLKDLEYLRQHNLALGGSLDNAVVLSEDAIVNEGGLRYPNEFVRHKMLDAVGDLFVIGHALLGKFSAYKSGHAVNNQLIRAVLADPSNYEIVTFCNEDDCPIEYVAALPSAA